MEVRVIVFPAYVLGREAVRGVRLGAHSRTKHKRMADLAWWLPRTHALAQAENP